MKNKEFEVLIKKFDELSKEIKKFIIKNAINLKEKKSCTTHPIGIMDYEMEYCVIDLNSIDKSGDLNYIEQTEDDEDFFDEEIEESIEEGNLDELDIYQLMDILKSL